MACNEAIKHCDRGTKLVDHPDRGLQCQLALESAFQELAERAAESGWTEEIATRSSNSPARASGATPPMTD